MLAEYQYSSMGDNDSMDIESKTDSAIIIAHLNRSSSPLKLYRLIWKYGKSSNRPFSKHQQPIMKEFLLFVEKQDYDVLCFFH